MEKEKTSTDLALRSLQKKFDQLSRNYEEAVEQARRGSMESNEEAQGERGVCGCADYH